MTFKEYIESLKIISYDDILKFVQNPQESNNIIFNLKRGMYEVVDIFDEQQNYINSYLFAEQDEIQICETLYRTLLESKLEIEFEYSDGIEKDYCCKVNNSYVHFPREKCLEWIDDKIEEERAKGNSPARHFL